MQKHSPSKESRFRTFWRERQSKSWSFFCPQCRAARKVSGHPNPGRLENYGRIGLCSLVFTLATWNWFELKGLVSFIPFWAAFEIFYRTRMRAIMACPHCGFDPYLYLADIQLARREIEDHWKRKFAEHGIPYPASKHGPVEIPVPAPEPETSEIHLERGPGEAEQPFRDN
jgi:hypothetical protein